MMLRRREEQPAPTTRGRCLTPFRVQRSRYLDGACPERSRRARYDTGALRDDTGTLGVRPSNQHGNRHRDELFLPDGLSFFSTRISFLQDVLERENCHFFYLYLDHNLFSCPPIMKMMSKMDSPHHKTHNMRYCTYFYGEWFKTLYFQYGSRRPS